MLHVADTHALFWYLTASPRLSSKIEEIFDFAEKGQGIIVIPSIVLAELLRILEKKKKSIPALTSSLHPPASCVLFLESEPSTRTVFSHAIGLEPRAL